jgi:hypothetical protein
VLELNAPKLSEDDSEEWPVTAAEAELDLVKGRPELADLLDQAICLAAVSDAAKADNNQAAQRLRTLMHEVGAIPTEQVDSLLLMLSRPIAQPD